MKWSTWWRAIRGRARLQPIKSLERLTLKDFSKNVVPVAEAVPAGTQALHLSYHYAA